MRHRKIPGKKHKGYKDPETQQAARNEKLSVKVSYFIPIITSIIKQMQSLHPYLKRTS